MKFAGRRFGVMQMAASQKLWRVPRFDLRQVHNLLDWEGHLETLKDWKSKGRVRYIGVTSLRQSAGKTSATMGARIRLHDMVAVLSQVRGVTSECDVRHSRDVAARAHG